MDMGMSVRGWASVRERTDPLSLFGKKRRVSKEAFQSQSYFKAKTKEWIIIFMNGKKSAQRKMQLKIIAASMLARHSQHLYTKSSWTDIVKINLITECGKSVLTL